MLLQKLHCPHGCQNSVLTESVKTITIGNSNLLLDNHPAGNIPQTEKVRVFTCSCCGNSFETHQRPSEKNVL